MRADACGRDVVAKELDVCFEEGQLGRIHFEAGFMQVLEDLSDVIHVILNRGGINQDVIHITKD